jgi:Fic family protein
MPLHKAYLHEVSKPQGILSSVKSVVDYIYSKEARRMHPIELASYVHLELLRIFPFTYNSGKVSRMVMNFILMMNGFLPGIIHASERQAYYEVAKEPSSGWDEFIARAIENSLDSAIRFLT